MTDYTNIDQIAQDILADMPLKEKVSIANLDEDKVPYLSLSTATGLLVAAYIPESLTDCRFGSFPYKVFLRLDLNEIDFNLGQIIEDFIFNDSI